ncbi:hypothetical protein OIU85_003589 [Salix viminalis]|uniref:Uncharacterized protein n=1 Tax=Salix viminalis TaxID=40686 RepID=A0A9Q0Q001_SALVM|nr:hypothetical protein OIU85_003589 [Salix viminalis]
MLLQLPLQQLLVALAMRLIRRTLAEICKGLCIAIAAAFCAITADRPLQLQPPFRCNCNRRSTVPLQLQRRAIAMETVEAELCCNGSPPVAITAESRAITTAREANSADANIDSWN